MIQAIIHYPNKELLNEVFSQTGLMPVAIGGMKEGHYLVVGYPEQANPLEVMLKAEPLTYIGTWFMNGTMYPWTTEDVLNEEGEVIEEDKDVTYRNYSPQKYLDALIDIEEKENPEDEVGITRRPTMEEAMLWQVSKVSGNPDRVLVVAEPKED